MLKMEKYLVGRNRIIPVQKSHNLGLDILNGVDDTIEFEDYLGGAILLIRCEVAIGINRSAFSYGKSIEIVINNFSSHSKTFSFLSR